ncbi:type I glyceraldehyde-3-phosphate dehydrogenase [Cohnella sp. AR92]|uniref:type I glyceraldehyde-3-phosphate dehydrogenase n=1 Tax=Cohnella sp. AR92 TaxID=648716 RepID=UPI000F8F27E3|nr:type I glyceraldehyde-3-phosphate dehydrogenase [Cohnella sp. AR92]RUS46232.1 type I glyceraldehyde-3-phosphate dehydrogenase [Cohnella sp. AR92]
MDVAISGTGRIGRLSIRRAMGMPSSNIQVKVINTTCTVETLAHLLQYDTVHGKWDAVVEVEKDRLIINGQSVRIVSERDPAKLPWRELGVELVIDSTGKFKDRAALQQHLASGAERVLLTAPGRDLDLTVVMGVNEEQYDPSVHRLLSAASCTTNCLAPVLSVMEEAFGIESGWMTSIHSYTNDQNHLDNPHKDLRRARSCTSSLIPTTTGVSKALSGVLPHLAPLIHGMSVRVPTQDVSLLDLQLDLKRPAGESEVREAFRTAANGEFARYLGYNELPLVSSDYIGNEKSAVVDGLSVMTRENRVKLLAWYDNEWAYASRVIDLAGHVAKANTPNHEGEKTCLTFTA